MERRRFLKVSGLAVAALAARFAFPWAAVAATATAVKFGGRMYRPGANGKVQVSTNGGSSWRLHSDLGAIYSVSGLTVTGGKLRATVAFGNRSFQLVLAPDAKRWLLG